MMDTVQECVCCNKIPEMISLNEEVMVLEMYVKVVPQVREHFPPPGPEDEHRFASKVYASI